MRSVLENVREIVVTEGFKNNLINEAFLMKKLGVSRSPIREALKHLEEERLIERRQGAGISLKTPSLQEAIEILDIRILLEGLAARYLAVNLTKEVLDKLKIASAEFNRVLRGTDDLKLRLADLNFHRIIIKNCGSRGLARFAENIHIITTCFKIAHATPSRKAFKELVYPHDKVIEALESGNPAKAEDVLRLHIEEGKKNFLRSFLGPGIKLG